VTGGPDPLPDWHELAEAIPGITGPMRGYLEQIACVLALGVGGPLCSALPFGSLQLALMPRSLSSVAAGLTRPEISGR